MDFRLRVEGAVLQPLSLSVDDLRHQFEPATTPIQFRNDERTVNTTFTGARLWDILQSAGIQSPSAPSLRLIARASDQFRCRLLWSEIDPALSDRLILVAYEQEGKPLVTKEGPLRLVVPGDERGQRYLRGLVLLTVLDKGRNEDTD